MNEGIPLLLDPYQSVRLYGLIKQPRSTLDWTDVIQENFTWRFLRVVGLSAEQLKTMQPDKTQWLQRGLVLLEDIPDMLVFPVNPLLDYKADIAELWRMMTNTKCTSDDLFKTGIRFEQLVKRGMNPEIMFHFQFTLCEWLELGMKTEDVQKMTSDQCENVFSLDKDEVVHIVRTFGSQCKENHDCDT